MKKAEYINEIQEIIDKFKNIHNQLYDEKYKNTKCNFRIYEQNAGVNILSSLECLKDGIMEEMEE